jgi:methionyl-tRNA synthetase
VCTDAQVLGFVDQLLAKDMVYLGEFEGWYDEGQEEYVTEKNAEEQDYKSAISGKPLVFKNQILLWIN